MRFDEFFDRTLIVNLPDRADRRRETAAALGKVGVEVAPGRVEFFPATRPDTDGGFPTRGAHGCFLSHLYALQQAREAGVERLLMLEDDVHPLACLRTAGATLFDALSARPAWEMAVLGWVRHRDHSLVQDAAPHWKATDEQFIGTHAYAVHGRAFDKLIGLLERCRDENIPKHEDGRRYHLDELYWVFGRDGSIDQLLAMPTLFGQRSSRSDVAGELAWKDRVPVVRGLAGLARRARNAVRG